MTAKNYYNMKNAAYTAGKEAMRIKTIIENAEQSQEGFKFKTLKKDDLDTDYGAYVDAVDLYQKSLYQSDSTTTKDDRLIDVLCLLSVKNGEIAPILSKNIHDNVIKFTMRHVQRMTPEGKAQKAAIDEKIQAAKYVISYFEENGKMPMVTDENGTEKQLECTLSEVKSDLAAAEKDMAELLASNVYEAAKLSRVTLGTFKKNFELFLGGMLSKTAEVVDSYVTLEERRLNNKWRKKQKDAADVNIPEDVFMEYWKKQDFDGLKKLIAEKRAEMEKADK